MAANDQMVIDINKGMHRVGKFQAFTDEVFSTYAEASAYATSGRYGGTAIEGQLIRVVPDEFSSEDDVKLYIIDKNYNLVSVTESIITDNKLTTQFDYGTASASNATSIVVPAGFVLSSISIKIIEPFSNYDAVEMKTLSLDEEYHTLISSGNRIEGTFGDMVTDEENSEFTFKFTESFAEKTKILLILNKIEDPERKGTGILKIN